jgi:hypothetical protein
MLIWFSFHVFVMYVQKVGVPGTVFASYRMSARFRGLVTTAKRNEMVKGERNALCCAEMYGRSV